MEAKYKLKDVLEALEFEELMSLKKDIDGGAISLKKLIKDRISEEQKNHQQSCSTCSSTLNLNNVNNFTLLFGPHDFVKKATFCGMDCMEYFLEELKQIRRA